MRHGNRGVTLMELMVVIVVIGILTAIAVPSYRQYVIRANRTEAKVALMQAQQGLEKCYTRFHRYKTNPPTQVCTADANLTGGVLSEDGNYRITIAHDRIATPSYTLTATPQQGQVGDTQCGNFLLNEVGQRDVSVAGNAARCW